MGSDDALSTSQLRRVGCSGYKQGRGLQRRRRTDQGPRKDKQAALGTPPLQRLSHASEEALDAQQMALIAVAEDRRHVRAVPVGAAAAAAGLRRTVGG